MSGEESTRRTLLRTLGSAGLGAVGSSTVATATATDADRTPSPSALYAVDPSRLVVGEDAVPQRFETIENSNDAPLLSRLRETDESFDDVEMAASGYAIGRDLDNPRGVISSLALVCEEVPNRDAVETAANRCMDSLAEAYEEELLVGCDVTQSRRHSSTHGRWTLDIALDGPPGDSSDASVGPFGTDTMHIQFRRNALLGTVVFGIADQQRLVDSRLHRLARTQWHQLIRAVRADV